jgi:hypothetical protein
MARHLLYTLTWKAPASRGCSAAMHQVYCQGGRDAHDAIQHIVTATEEAGSAVYQLLNLSIPLLAQAAVACMRGLRRLRLIRCRLHTSQMPGLPNILSKVPSLTVRIGRLVRLHKGLSISFAVCRQLLHTAIGLMLVEHALLLYMLISDMMACVSDCTHAVTCP